MLRTVLLPLMLLALAAGSGSSSAIAQRAGNARPTWQQLDHGLRYPTTESAPGTSEVEYREAPAREGRPHHPASWQPSHAEIIVGEPVYTDGEIILEDDPEGEEIAVPHHAADEVVYHHAWEESPAFWARVFSSSGWCGDHGLYAQGDFVLLHRTSPKGTLIGLDISTPSAGVVNTADTSFRIEPGMRITIGRPLYRDAKNRDHSIETTFLGLFQWESSTSLRANEPNNLFTPVDPAFALDPFLSASVGGFNTADTYDLSHSASLDSIEVNGRIRYRLGRDRMVMNPDGTWSRHQDARLVPSMLYGIRVISVDERYRFESRRDGVPFSDFGGSYRADTQNSLVGLQFGGDFARREETYSLGIQGKVGAYVNFSSQESQIVSNDIFNPGLLEFDVERRATEASMAFAAELNFQAAYYLNPNLALRANAEMMWLQGLAVASEQLDLTFGAPASVNVAANAFFIGLSIGLESRW